MVHVKGIDILSRRVCKAAVTKQLRELTLLIISCQESVLTCLETLRSLIAVAD